MDSRRGYATVLSSSRRYIWIHDQSGNRVIARASNQALDITVGDRVLFHKHGDEFIIDSVEARKNLLSRCFNHQTKKLAANLDLLIIVTAQVPLFNTAFIDRVTVAATSQKIPILIVVNKIDLPEGMPSCELEPYKRSGIPLIFTSALRGDGISEIREALQDPTLSLIALTGTSGVGKSTILNALIPNSSRKTAEVSSRTGQGKQTTSQSFAYSYPRENGTELLITDLPGVQNFGLHHLSKHDIEAGFFEFRAFSTSCEYGNCTHTVEPNCAVLNAVKNGEISQKRYLSYREIFDDLCHRRPSKRRG